MPEPIETLIYDGDNIDSVIVESFIDNENRNHITEVTIHFKDGSFKELKYVTPMFRFSK